MPPGIQLQLTMTLGDLIVAGTTVVVIIGAYYAIKGTLASLTAGQSELVTKVAKHGERLDSHGESIASLNTKVFGRRKGDPERE